MITVLTGDNNFELRQRLLAIKDSAAGEFETIDGQDLEAANLENMLFGNSLFSQSRTIIFRQLSDNLDAWLKLDRYIEKIDDQTDIFLVEPKLDKRTKTYKNLKKHATIETFSAWTYRDMARAISWARQTAEHLGLKSNQEEAKYLINRVGFDQWRLYNSIEKLALVGSMSKKIVDAVIEEDIHENVFNLLEMSINGDLSGIVEMINNLENTELPYSVFGLMSGQVFQLVALVSSPSDEQVIKDLSLHPYVAKKQLQLAKKLGKTKLNKLVELFAEADQSIRFARPDSVWAEITSLLIAVCKI